MDRVINQRYTLLRPLGEGGMGEVFLAADQDRPGALLALKYLSRRAGLSSEVERLREEFRKMSRLSHPNLVQVHDLETDRERGEPFIVMEYVDGVDFVSACRGAPLTLVVDLTLQALLALEYLHAQGYVHRDLKPENLIVTPPRETAGRARVRLLDFGLSSALGQEDPQAGGSLPYAAPEQFRGEGVDHRADLYSLGVLVYQAIAGRLPFEEVSPEALIQAHLTIDPAPPGRHRAGLDPAIEAIVLRLLRKRPEERYAGARPVIEALQRLSSDATEAPEAEDLMLRTPRLVGREDLLEELDRILAAQLAPEPPAGPLRLLLCGAAGSGKSRLLEEARARARSRGLEVLVIDASAGSSRPFDLLQRLEEQIRSAHKRLHRAAGDEGGGRKSEPTSFPEPRGASLAQAVQDVCTLSPLLLAIDNLHAADPDSVDALAGFLSSAERERVFVLASSRLPLEQIGAKLACAWPDEDLGWQRSLEPLSHIETALLLNSLAGLEPEASVPEFLLARAAGNPRFALEWARMLMERGLLRTRDGSWSLRLDESGRMEAPTGLVDLARARLQELGAPATTLARVLAVLDRPARGEELEAFSGLERRALDEAARELAHRGLLSDPAAELETLALAHAGLRDAVLGACEHEARALHARVAAWLQARETVTASELAWRWRQAKEAPRALEWALRAADEAKSAGAGVHEVRMLEWALEALGDKRQSEQIDLLLRIACIHQGADRHEAAALTHERAMQAARRSKNPAAVLEALVGMHQCRLNLGNWEEVERLGALIGRQLALCPDPYLEAKFLRTQAAIAQRRGDIDQAVKLAMRASERFEACGHPVEAALCLNNLASHLLWRRDPEQVESICLQSERMLEQAGATRWLYLPRGNLGILEMWRGHWQEAERRLQEVCEDLKERGAFSYLFFAGMNLGISREHTGALDLALSDYEASAEQARRQGFLEVRGHALDRHGALLRRLGLRERAQRLHEEGLAAARRVGHPVQVSYLSSALAEDLCESGGDPARAAALAEEASTATERLGHVRSQLRALLAGGQAALLQGRLESAMQCLRKARDLSLPEWWRAERAHREAVTARVALDKGDEREAKAAIERGLEDARHDSHALLELELLCLRIGSGLSSDRRADQRRLVEAFELLTCRTSDTTIVELARHAPAWKEVLAEAEGLPGGERQAHSAVTLTEKKALDALAEVGRMIGTLDDPDRLASSLLERARSLVGADRALLILADPEDPELRPLASSGLPSELEVEALDFSRAALSQGMESPILVLDAPADPRLSSSLSVRKFGIRSVLCVPLRLRGETVGAVYLDSLDRVLEAGPDHLCFVEAFAHHAAAALDTARMFQRLRGERERLRERVRERHSFHALIGKSPAMQEVFDLLETFSKSDLPVLITGESGTGKELVARALHYSGARQEGPFVAENCAAIPENLLESELFGHLRGAFTGADRDRRGVFVEATGGTLLLDEIGEMSPAVQAKLLRVLQEKEVRPLGAPRALSVDVRVLATTHHNLAAALRQGRFREDLLFRLRVLSLHLPPLRERLEDLRLLVRHFLEEHRRQHGHAPEELSGEVVSRLERHPWPGNVRELRGEVQKMAMVAAGARVEWKEIEQHPELFETLLRPGRFTRHPRTGTLKELERQQVERALKAASGDRQRAADMLGLSRATLYRKIRRYRITDPAGH
ncbi:MAG: sigma 54-interacting transcriptional regulator [Acidobacteriota bacterium]